MTHLYQIRKKCIVRINCFVKKRKNAQKEKRLKHNFSELSLYYIDDNCMEK